MSPRFSVINVMNIAIRNVEHLCNAWFRKANGAKPSYFQNLFIIKFYLRMVHSLIIWHIAMRNLIKGIFAAGSPAKILQKAITSNSVSMTPFHSWGTRTHKSQKNQPMHEAGKDYFVSDQIHHWVTTHIFAFKDSLRLTIQYGSPPDPPPVRSHLSLVTNLVSREALNWQPSFLSLIGDCGRLFISHGASLLGGIASRLEPYRSYDCDAACFL